MIVMCKDIIELQSLKNLQLIGGSAGLERAVQWVHFIDLPDPIKWVQGGELLIITGIGLQGNPANLLPLLRSIAQKNLAGLIVNVGPYIEKIPAEVAILADELAFPVFELPWEVKLVEVTREICSYIVAKQMEEKSVADLVENILFNPLGDPGVLYQRAAYFMYDLTLPHQVAVIHAENIDTFIKHKFKDEKSIIRLKLQFQQFIREVLNQHQKKALSVLRVDKVILLMPGNPLETDSIHHNNKIIAAEILNHIETRLPGLIVNIGLGELFSDLHEAKQSLEQAEQALKYGQLMNEKRRIYCYSDLGVYKLIFNVKNNFVLQSFYRETLGKMLDYDKLHGASLNQSLTVYLQENGNILQASKKLFIHVNTLKYRLRKIEEITGKDLDNVHDRFALYIATLIAKYVN